MPHQNHNETPVSTPKRDPVRSRAGCMSDKQYRGILKRRGLTHTEAARIIGCDLATSYRYANGDRKIPGSVEGLLRLHERSRAVAVDGESLPSKRDHSSSPPEKVTETNGNVVQFLRPVDVNLDKWFRGEIKYEERQVLTAATERFHKRYGTLNELVIDILDGKTTVTEREIHPSVLIAAVASVVPSTRSRGAKPIPGATRTTAGTTVQTLEPAQSPSLRRQLSELCYTDHAISNMNPAEGHERVIKAIPPENLGVALELAGVGIPVFPARVHLEDGKWKKVPYIKGWQHGSTDQQQIKSWWREYPDAVAGIALGGAGLIVIDADRHGGPDGVAALDALVAERGPLPVGPVTRTAGNGLHFIFRQPDGEQLGNGTGCLPKGVDVRGAGGWIVAPGSTRPDGAMWAPTEGSPALIDAYFTGFIPTLPTWLVDMIRSPRPAKEREETRPQEERSTTSRATSDLRGMAYAETALADRAAELAQARLGERNNLANGIAYRMATMAARGWIDRNTVFNALFNACERNGLVDEDGEDCVRRTLSSGFNRGMLKPHSDLPDRLRQPRQRSSTDHDDMQFLRFQSEVRALFRSRFPYETDKAVEEADARIAEITSTDRRQRGIALQATFEECKELKFKAWGRRRGPRFPSTFLPCDVSEDKVKAWRKAEKNAADKATKAKRRIEKKAQQASVNDLDDKASAVHAYLQDHPGQQSIDDIDQGVKDSRAFKNLKSGSRKNALRRLITPPLGKVSPLAPFIRLTTVTAKNGGPKIMVEVRKNET
jgi:hypothetical protein